MANNNDFKTVRGSARIFADDTFEFKPKSDGKPMKRVLYQNRASSLYETTGSVPKKVAHLVIDSNSADPLYDLYEQLDCLAKKMETAEKDAKKTDKTKRRPQGRRLLATEGLAVACTPSALTVSISIPLAQYPDYKDRFYQLINETAKCLAFNKDFLNKRQSALLKNGAE